MESSTCPLHWGALLRHNPVGGRDVAKAAKKSESEVLPIVGDDDVRDAEQIDEAFDNADN